MNVQLLLTLFVEQMKFKYKITISNLSKPKFNKQTNESRLFLLPYNVSFIFTTNKYLERNFKQTKKKETLILCPLI